MSKELSYDSRDLIFLSWSAPEEGWRWTLGTSPGLLFRLDAFDPEQAYLLEFYAGSQGHQDITVTLNTNALGKIVYEGFEPVHKFLLLPGETLTRGENRVRLEIPGASRTADDSRLMGLALRSFRLYPLLDDRVGFRDDVFFGSGWSMAEDAWRWSDGAKAELLYPLGRVTAESYALELKAGTLDRQRVEILINDHSLGSFELQGFEPQIVRIPVPGSILRSYQANRIVFGYPDARSTPQDLRQLGIAFFSLKVLPLTLSGAGLWSWAEWRLKFINHFCRQFNVCEKADRQEQNR
jgi:hypothetical protein